MLPRKQSTRDYRLSLIGVRARVLGHRRDEAATRQRCIVHNASNEVDDLDGDE